MAKARPKTPRRAAKVVHKTIPKHCPGCGKEFPGKPIRQKNGAVVGWIPHSFKLPEGVTTTVDRMPMSDNPGEPVTSWDCFCPRCGWSGEISPDK